MPAHPLRRTRTLVVAACVVLAALGLWWFVRTPAPSGDPATAARTTFPDLPAPTADPTLAGLEGLAPAPGSVVQVVGPFDDRFRLTGLRLDGGALTGTLEVTSEVTELVDLEVLAGFYADDGTLVGSGRYRYHADGHATADDEGPPDQDHPFRIAVPALPDGASVVVAAGVGVPVLVNE